MQTQTFSAGSYKVTISERVNPTKYTNCPYMAEYSKDTPKGKYSTVKIIKRYVFPTIEKATEYAQKITAQIQTNLDYTEQKKQEQKVKNAGIDATKIYQIGDIVVNTWGWEQTNVDFYKVTKVTARQIEVVEIGDKNVEGSDGFMSAMVMPDVDNVGEKTYKLRVKAGWGNDSHSLSNPASYYYFRKWDGRPEYKSWYA
jgi:hypothetical protein